METADSLTTKKKFMPNIAEISECLEKVDVDQGILFKRATEATTLSETAISSNSSSVSLSERLRGNLKLIMDEKEFTSWSHSMLEFRYLATAETVLVIVKSPFYADYVARRFSGSIIKAAQSTGLNAHHASFKLAREVP